MIRPVWTSMPDLQMISVSYKYKNAMYSFKEQL
jgi:hypothetical protein